MIRSASVDVCESLTNTTFVVIDSSAPLIPKLSIGHDSDPVPSTSYAHNLSP